MKDLKEIRAEIDSVDKELVSLYEKRMALTEQVADYKLSTGKMVFLLPKSKSTRVLTLVLPQRLFPAGRGIIPLNLNHPLLLWSSPVTAMW